MRNVTEEPRDKCSREKVTLLSLSLVPIFNPPYGFFVSCLSFLYKKKNTVDNDKQFCEENIAFVSWIFFSGKIF